MTLYKPLQAVYITFLETGRFTPSPFRPRSFRPNSKSFRPNIKSFRPNLKSFRLKLFVM